jgi:hypothetical protein
MIETDPTVDATWDIPTIKILHSYGNILTEECFLCQKFSMESAKDTIYLRMFV